MAWMSASAVRLGAIALTLGLAASVAGAQQLGSDGSNFLGAVRSKDAAKAIGLISARGSTVVNYRGDADEAALHIVARRRDAMWLSYLLEQDADPDIRARNGDTPLIVAARVGFGEGADVLLAKRAKVDAANRQGETALIVAVQQRQPQLVRKLLEAGANPDRTDTAAGYSARDYARRDRRSTELLRIIEAAASAKAKIIGPKLN